MKTRIFGDVGAIDVLNSSFKPITFIFPTDSMIDWYPLDINYEYRYNPSNHRLYLIPLEKHGEWGYGITSQANRVDSKVASFKVDEWYCKEVSEANHKIIEQAKQLGLKTLNDTYTTRDIARNLSILDTDVEQVLLNKIERQMIDNISREAFGKHRKLPSEQRDVAMFAHATKQDLELFQLFGKLRVMTRLMQNGV